MKDKVIEDRDVGDEKDFLCARKQVYENAGKLNQMGYGHLDKKFEKCKGCNGEDKSGDKKCKDFLDVEEYYVKR